MNPSQLEGAIRSTLRLQDTVHNDWLVPEAATGNDNTLWQTYRSGVGVINRTWAFTDNPKPIELLEVEMRCQWRLFILAAKHIEPNHPAQDRLTWLILWTREMGVLSRARENSDRHTVTEEALTTHGHMWIDLPFLLQDVQEAWRDIMTSATPASHCLNLTAAIARLAAIGLLDDGFSGCGLEIMVQALEAPKKEFDTTYAVVSEGGEQSDAQVRGQPSLGLCRLLPLVQAWLYHAGRKLLQLSVTMDSIDESGWRINAESVSSVCPYPGIDRIGFSVARFRFWKDELTKLEEHDFEDAATKETARLCSGLINNAWDEFFGLRVRKAAV